MQGHEVKFMIYWERSCQSNAHGAHICHSQIKIKFSFYLDLIQVNFLIPFLDICSA